MNDGFEAGFEAGKEAAERELSVELVSPSMYTDGFEDGYAQALMDILDDECLNPLVVEAREWMSKKERRADR